MAWLHVDEDRCPNCGNPLTLTTDFELRTEWEADEVTCNACRVRGARQEQRDRGPGEYVTVSRRVP